MAKKIVSIRDSKTECFGLPTVVTNLAEAERQFGDLCADSSCLVGKHPEDFAIWCLGEFDETQGITAVAAPFVVCHGADFKR